MPHLIIEYSANISAAKQFSRITEAAHKVMLDSGLFTRTDIKTRSYMAEDFLVGENGKQGKFVHAVVYLLEGRTIEQKQSLSDKIRDTLQPLLQDVGQLSVDIRDMAKETYRKNI